MSIKDRFLRYLFKNALRDSLDDRTAKYIVRCIKNN
jgi:hypothetical protein